MVYRTFYLVKTSNLKIRLIKSLIKPRIFQRESIYKNKILTLSIRHALLATITALHGMNNEKIIEIRRTETT